jgi:hypothetical protein
VVEAVTLLRSRNTWPLPAWLGKGGNPHFALQHPLCEILQAIDRTCGFHIDVTNSSLLEYEVVSVVARLRLSTRRHVPEDLNLQR